MNITRAHCNSKIMWQKHLRDERAAKAKAILAAEVADLAELVRQHHEDPVNVPWEMVREQAERCDVRFSLQLAREVLANNREHAHATASAPSDGSPFHGNWRSK